MSGLRGTVARGSLAFYVSHSLRIDLDGGRVLVEEGVDGRQVVVPVVMRRPFVAGQALRPEPDLAAARAPALGLECVPGVVAGALPTRIGHRLPMTLGTVDFHGILGSKWQIGKGQMGKKQSGYNLPFAPCHVPFAIRILKPLRPFYLSFDSVGQRYRGRWH